LFQALFLLNAEGRIVSTREPGGSTGPLFSLVRATAYCAWAIRAGVPQKVADELDRLARDEAPATDFRAAPLHAARYLTLLSGRSEFGPAFRFPYSVAEHADAVVVEDERLLYRNFRGWIPGEIAAGRSPVLAVFADEYPVSVCFCARRSDAAAEAGVETAARYRGQGLAVRVTSAWARAVRASGRIPLYSTDGSNQASLAVARKLGLIAYASHWRIYE
jgi:RimJ/RimL family protein N-acetyltransferase